MKERLTQRELLFGIYRAPKDSVNPGLNVWFNGRYIWPRNRKQAHRKAVVNTPAPAGLFEVSDGTDSRPADAEVPVS